VSSAQYCLIDQTSNGGKTMALVNRIARLFKADFHAVLDQHE